MRRRRMPGTARTVMPAGAFLTRMPLLTPVAVVMPGGVRSRIAQTASRLMLVKLQAAGGGSDFDTGSDGGAGACVEILMRVRVGDLYTILVPQGGEAGQALAGSGQGGGSAQLFADDSTDPAALIAVAPGGGGAGDTTAGGAGRQVGEDGAGSDAGGGEPGGELQGGDGIGGDLSAGGSAKGWPDGGRGAGQGGVQSGGGGGGGGKPGGDGGGPGDNGSGGQGGSAWVSSAVLVATYLDGSGATPHPDRDALLVGFGTGGKAVGEDGEDGRVLIYLDGDLAETLDYTGAAVLFQVPAA